MDPMISKSSAGSTSMQLHGIGKKEASASISLVPTPAQVNVQSATTIDSHKSQEQVVAELQKAIDAIQGPQKSLEISVHAKTHAIMIKVLNKETGELIREVPPEKILDLAARMMEITGIIVDKKI
ncbi:flagellar protein FlaG [Paenibacillus sp. S150]|uniref:flagellar protein FlaG n=1 Tax=Paenibacillus sp. S150 TaxID=2749826 RepID=UPI001C597317|nr:flagellar protein FlaG [Paenibacillus sp. S150]MBW4081664.1 flagellar protein FlaG [Paenibacillus sp. S150]